MSLRQHRPGAWRAPVFRTALAGAMLASPAAAAQDTSEESAGRIAANSVLVRMEAGTLGFEEAGVKAGEVTFRVENVGDIPHRLTIEGPDTKTGVEDLILPHTAETLTVELKPGTYRLYCPLEDHAEQGMEATLTAAE